jgi:hypothetical protein
MSDIGFRLGFATVQAAIRALGNGPYFSVPLDILTSPQTVLIVPGVAGFIFEGTKLGYQVSTKAGVATGGPTVSFGDNATVDNILGATAGFPATAEIVVNESRNVSGLATAQLRVPGAGVSVKISAPGTGTGGFASTVRYWVTGGYIPAP